MYMPHFNVANVQAVGEPPLLLASSAFFAVKDAIRAARKAAGASLKFRLDSPALPADIRMACQDVFAKKVRRSSDLAMGSDPRLSVKTLFPVFVFFLGFHNTNVQCARCLVWSRTVVFIVF